MAIAYKLCYKDIYITSIEKKQTEITTLLSNR